MVNVLPLFGPVGPEMLVILLVLVLLFGANKIPKLARSTGQAMGEFKKGREEIEEELNEMTDPDASPSETVSEPVDEDESETETEKAS
ncbi:MAG: twin-arginine translocase TatA/TatE family subunit [Halohasta sp.]